MSTGKEVLNVSVEPCDGEFARCSHPPARRANASLRRLRSDRRTTGHILGFGDVQIRQGESDLEVLRHVFIQQKHYSGFNHSLNAFATLQCETMLQRGVIPIVVDAEPISELLRFGSPEAILHLVAIEPDPSSTAPLRTNVRRRMNVAVIESAVGAVKGIVALSSDVPSWAFSTTRAVSGVPIVSKSEACANVARGELFIAKIDMEGIESELFSSNTDRVANCPLVIIEPPDWMRLREGLSHHFRRVFDQLTFAMLISGESLIYANLEYRPPPMAP